MSAQGARKSFTATPCPREELARLCCRDLFVRAYTSSILDNKGFARLQAGSSDDQIWGCIKATRNSSGDFDRATGQLRVARARTAEKVIQNFPLGDALRLLESTNI